MPIFLGRYYYYRPKNIGIGNISTRIGKEISAISVSAISAKTNVGRALITIKPFCSTRSSLYYTYVSPNLFPLLTLRLALETLSPEFVYLQFFPIFVLLVSLALSPSSVTSKAFHKKNRRLR